MLRRWGFLRTLTSPGVSSVRGPLTLRALNRSDLVRLELNGSEPPSHARVCAGRAASAARMGKRAPAPPGEGFDSARILLCKLRSRDKYQFGLPKNLI